MSKLDELLQGCLSGDIATTSELKVRDEKIQTKDTIKRYLPLKKEPGSKIDLCMLTELAIPFNPFTVKEDDKYNRDNKFRTLLSRATTIKMLKNFYNENEEMKKAFMERVMISEWDTSNVDSVTEEDHSIFNRFTVARTFTVPAVKINIQTVTGSKYGRDYLCHVERDPITGEIIGTPNKLVLCNKLLREMAYEKIEALRTDWKAGKVALTDKQFEDKCSEIKNMIVVSGVRPLNYNLGVAIPLTAKSQFSKDIDPSEFTPDFIFESTRLIKRTEKMDTILNRYINGELEVLDIHHSFYEVTMNCPNIKDDAMKLGKQTTFDNPITQIGREKWYPEFAQALDSYIDEDKNAEKIFMNSAYVYKPTTELYSSLTHALSKIIDINDPALTSKVVERNIDILTEIFPDKIEDLVAKSAFGDLAEGSVSDEGSDEIGKESLLDVVNQDLKLDSTEEVNLEQ